MSLHIRSPFYSDGKRGGLGVALKGYFADWLGTELNSVMSQRSKIRKDYKSAVGDGQTSDLIMSTVLWIARKMAESPIGVQREGIEEVDFTHPLARLLKHPSPYFSGSAWMMAMAINFLTDGNAYALKIRDGHLNVVGLQAIPWWAIRPHVPAVGYIDYYEYFPLGQSGKMVQLPPEELLHLRYGVDPNNMRLGLSPLRILLESVYTDLEASLFTALMLKNGGVIGTILSPKEGGARMGALGDDERATKAYMKQEFAGAKAGSLMVMTGPTQVDYIGVDSSKMDLGRLRTIPEERVSAVLGVPAAVVGLGAGLSNTKVGATMTEMRAMAYEDCIIPMQQLWADEMDLQLMPEFESNADLLRTAFDNSHVKSLQEDIGKVTDRALKELMAGAISLQEYREQKGYDIVGIPNVMYLPMSTTVVPLNQLGVEPETPDETATEPGEEPTEPESTAEDATEPGEEPGEGKKKWIIRT